MSLFIGIGNPLRGDDAAGLLVAARLRELAPPGLRVIELEGEPIDLIEAFDGADSVLVADAVSSDGEPGTVHRFDAGAAPLPARLAGPSTHALGLLEAVELARALGRLPERLAVLGIEGARFEAGSRPLPEVQRAATALADEIAAGMESHSGPGVSYGCGLGRGEGGSGPVRKESRSSR
jgi:hydrogenase maturation protease